MASTREPPEKLNSAILPLALCKQAPRKHEAKIRTARATRLVTSHLPSMVIDEHEYTIPLVCGNPIPFHLQTCEALAVADDPKQAVEHP